MTVNHRNFELIDPFGRHWQVEFRWQQTAISIRHADAVDVKWDLYSDGEIISRVIALPHPLLLELSKKLGRELSDPWCLKLAAAHLKTMVETWQDMDKTLVTVTAAELDQAAAAVSASEAKLREEILADA
jgi:hypothetical protein